jgi:hypothetical protein
MAKAWTMRKAAACCAALPLTVVLASTANASTPGDAAGSGTATVGVSDDAWYSTSSACTASPTGCLPAAAPASAYPAMTLHVGVAAGQEESRTYLGLDLTGLPAGTSLSGGILRLPVGSSQDGSLAPDTATMQACLATGTFKDDVAGSPEKPPNIDCKAASSPAKYVAAAGAVPEMFTVNLAPFTLAWSGGATSAGIALVPTTDTGPGSAWHVALSGHDRAVAAAMHISATVTYSSSGTSDSSTSFDAAPPVDTSSTGTGSASFAAPPLAPVATPQLPTTTTPQAPVVAPQASPVAPAPQLQPAAAVTVGGYAYPGVFLLPILLAIAGGWLARSLTRDLTPAV